VDSLREVLGSSYSLQTWQTKIENIYQDDEFFVFSGRVKERSFAEEDRKVLELIRNEPMTIMEISSALGVHQHRLNLRHLEDQGAVNRIGFTPTDALHALGEYVEYDTIASRLAAEHRAKLMCFKGMEAFCKEVKESVIRKIAHDAVTRLLYEDCGKTSKCATCRAFIDKIVTQVPGIDFMIDMKVNKRIIGIGAPVKAYLPSVASRLNTGLFIPEHSEVGNAVGAISGNIMETVEILILPQPGMNEVEDPPCSLHSRDEMREFESMSKAISYARYWGENTVRRMAEEAGAEDIEVFIQNKDVSVHAGQDFVGEMLMHTVVRVTAIGKPRMLSKE
jgi:N-methylhydantoinase A/oxoprolinase/acetone carboxylase beta subunit